MLQTENAGLISAILECPLDADSHTLLMAIVIADQDESQIVNEHPFQNIQEGIDNHDGINRKQKHISR